MKNRLFKLMMSFILVLSYQILKANDGISMLSIEDDHPIIHAGSLSKNYIVSAKFTIPSTSTDGVVDRGAIITAKYFDGLGREEQNVIQNGSPSGDLADYTEYNTRGKASRKWLPVKVSSIGGNADFCPLNTLAGQLSGDTAPYTSIYYEATQESRELETRAPGQAWQQHAGVRKEYRLNSSSVDSLKCGYYKVTPTGVLKRAGNYPTGELYVTIITDEDGHRVTEFVDKDQHKVLSRQQIGSSFADTYYVYDIYGNLCYVLPPMASASLANLQNTIPDTNEHIQKLCYVYKYDHRNRCIEKKLPGCSPVYYIYDSCDNLVYSQDGNQRSRGKWSFTAYDALGRVAYTGERSLSSTASTLRESYRCASPRVQCNGSSSILYSLLPGVTMADVNNVNFYDDYEFLYIGADEIDNSNLFYSSLQDYDQRHDLPSSNTTAKGLLTGTLTRTLDASRTFLGKSMYYDNHGNVIQTHEQNLLGGYEHYYYHLSFTGKPLVVRHEHTTADTINVEILRYTYDNMERLLTTSVERDGAEPVLLCCNTYGDLGRLATQSLGGTAEGSHAESLAYAYNVRGWTTGITGTNFSQTLHYEDAGENSCYNGNIGSVEWSAKELIDETTRVSQQYSYTYDGLNRLVSAAYSAPGASDWDNTFIANNPRDYSSSYTYDLNGNLTAIKRKGISGKVNVFDYTVVSFGDIDDLSLEYNGNQLKKVTDQCDNLTYEGAMDFKDGERNDTEYTYDANGNMTSDRNKGIHSISYNILNLPQSVMFDDGHETRYTYAADGRKLKVEYLLNNIRFVDDITPIGPPFGGGINPLSHDDAIELPIDTASISVTPLIQTLMVRDYCGNHIYRNGVLERVLNDVGYADSTGYHYQVKDYRGDVRAVVAQNGTLEETNSYYPYGMLHGTSAIASTQPYKYTGKELDRENGLDWYDFEARMLMSDLGRTTTLDPLAEKYYSISPYVWCLENPICTIDLDGKDPIYAQKGFLFWKHVEQIGDDGNHSSNSYLVKGKIQKAVEFASKNGEIYTGDLSESNDVMLIPTGALLSDVIQSVNDTKASGKENGGHAYQGDANATRWDEGEPATQEKKDNETITKASLTAFIVDGKNVEPKDASNLKMWWHVHPKVTIGEITLGQSIPSEKDKNYQKTMKLKGYTGNTFVIGAGSNTVTFYNKRTLMTVSWNDFLLMGGYKK